MSNSWIDRIPDPLRRVILVFVVLAVGIPVILRVMGYEAIPATSALLRGSVGSGYAFTSGTLVRATPVMMLCAWLMFVPRLKRANIV